MVSVSKDDNLKKGRIYWLQRILGKERFPTGSDIYKKVFSVYSFIVNNIELVNHPWFQ